MRRSTFALLVVLGAALVVWAVDRADAEIRQPAPSAASIVSALQTTVDPGLAGTVNSLTYRVAEIERHIHVRERWYGKVNPQTETDWAASNRLAFRCTTGLNTYGVDAGDVAQVIGTADTPVLGGVYFDLHKVFILGASDEIYQIRFAYGTGTHAAALAAGQYSELMAIVETIGSLQTVIAVEIKMPRMAVGTKVWADCANTGDNQTFDFVVGLHEYEG